MLGRRRRTTVGLTIAALLTVGWFASLGATAEEPDIATPARVGVIAGAVEHDGVPVGTPSGWEVGRLSTGDYELRFAAEVDISVTTWDTPAAVTFRSVAATTWLVEFTDDAGPIDTAFSFTAVPAT